MSLRVDMIHQEIGDRIEPAVRVDMRQWADRYRPNFITATTAGEIHRLAADLEQAAQALRDQLIRRDSAPEGFRSDFDDNDARLPYRQKAPVYPSVKRPADYRGTITGGRA